MTASDVIAVVAIVAGATVTLLSPFVSARVDRRRDRNRFEHERVMQARVDAARTYGKARETLRYVHPNYSSVVAGSEDVEVRLRGEIGDSLSQLAVVSALGWNETVRAAAATLAYSLESVVMTNWAFVGALRNNHTATTYDQVEPKWDKAWEDLEVFRQAITEEEPIETAQ